MFIHRFEATRAKPSLLVRTVAFGITWPHFGLDLLTDESERPSNRPLIVSTDTPQHSGYFPRSASAKLN
jgi:hypothetical protein